MASPEKFGRTAAITIAKAQPDKFFENPNNKNAVVIRNLRVKFKIEKSLSKEPNSCELEIYNLSERTRGEMQALPLHVRVDVGYQQELARAFIGDLSFCSHEHQGVNWVTKLHMGDGERSFINARVSKSFGAGTSVKTVLLETAKSMGLKVPSSIAEAKELATQFVSGTAITGSARNKMTDLLAPRGLDWSIQDGELQILGPNGVRQTTAILVGPRNGMIGTPELGAPKKPGESVTIKVKTLLDPGLTPGGRIKMAAENTQGLFKIYKVTHTGDTRGKEWYSDVEGRML